MQGKVHFSSSTLIISCLEFLLYLLTEHNLLTFCIEIMILINGKDLFTITAYDKFYYLGRGHAQLPAFEWLHVDCFPALIQLACLLPPKEDSLRNRTTKVSSFYLLWILILPH